MPKTGPHKRFLRRVTAADKIHQTIGEYMVIQHAKRAAGDHKGVLFIQILRNFTTDGHIDTVLKPVFLGIKQITKPVGIIGECIAHRNAFVVVGLQYAQFDAFHIRALGCGAANARPAAPSDDY